MSTLALLVVLLLTLVSLLTLTVLGYLVHYHPVLARPLSVVLAGAAVLVSLVADVAQAGAR